jgi:small GTP-binding protein
MEKKNETIYRPPVVVILGHIDHGKTTLLTAIRDFKVLEKESGGITQHVGAYQVIHDGRKITFIDTPGHESFSAIRARGSNLADIAVLVIDAVEGVKKQTKEAIEHIKKANISTIVALNKMDKPGADPEMVKQQLFKENIIVESYGGTIPSVEISALTGKGITELLDMILLVAEMEELKSEMDTGEGENIGFAISIDKAKRSIEQVKTLGRISYPYMGVRYIILNKEISKARDIEVDYGALIVGDDEPAVVDGSPAQRAGIKEGDVILEINGEKITEDNSLAKIISKYNPFELLNLKILRDGQEIYLNIILGEWEE